MSDISRGMSVKLTVGIFFCACLGPISAAVVSWFLYVVFGAELIPYMSWPVLLTAFVLLSIVLCVAWATVGGYLLARELGRDLDDLRIGVRLLTDGKLNYRWTERGVREILDLRRQLNRMADKWQREIALLQSMAEEKEELAQHAREAGVMAERQRLARELHDAVSQQLFALSMTATAAARLASTNPAAVKDKALLMEKMAHQALSEMRALLMHLRPVRLDKETLAEAVKSMLEELEAKSIVKTELEIQTDVQMSRAIEMNLLRIVQEAVANTLRHANASVIRVKLTAEEDTMRLSIEDNGVGFDLESVAHRKISYGLRTMRERAEECGGSLSIVTLPGKGTRVQVQVPRVSYEGERFGAGRDQSDGGRRSRDGASRPGELS